MRRGKQFSQEQRRLIGEANEDVVRLALSRLKDKGEINQFFKNDVSGIDFIIILEDGKKISLQVKSSIQGLNLHQLSHPDIPCLVINNGALKIKNSKRERLIRKAMKDIRQFIQSSNSNS